MRHRGPTLDLASSLRNLRRETLLNEPFFPPTKTERNHNMKNGAQFIIFFCVCDNKPNKKHDAHTVACLLAIEYGTVGYGIVPVD